MLVKMKLTVGLKIKQGTSNKILSAPNAVLSHTL